MNLVEKWLNKHEEEMNKPLQKNDFKKLMKMIDSHTKYYGLWGTDEEVIERCRKFLQERHYFQEVQQEKS